MYEHVDGRLAAQWPLGPLTITTYPTNGTRNDPALFAEGREPSQRMTTKQKIEVCRESLEIDKSFCRSFRM
jgi:hypothetical protein